MSLLKDFSTRTKKPIRGKKKTMNESLDNYDYLTNEIISELCKNAKKDFGDPKNQVTFCLSEGIKAVKNKINSFIYQLSKCCWFVLF